MRANHTTFWGVVAVAGTDGNYYLGTGFTISGTSSLIAVGIAILASAFAIGARLTRDTEGPV